MGGYCLLIPKQNPYGYLMINFILWIKKHWFFVFYKPVSVILLLVIFFSGCSSLSPKLDRQAWNEYRVKFITLSGRVIDTGQCGVSHSEGQGFAMLLAVGHNDKATFLQLWQWTQAHLQIRKDRLFAWRWNPADHPPVKDMNNASDGDILIAWALFRAADKWRLKNLRKSANEIVSSIKNNLIYPSSVGPVLLPGINGFQDEKGVDINLSYWIYPAFIEFDKQQPDILWRELINSGLSLLEKARFGRWRLPPDWLRLEKNMFLSDKYPPRFSFDAVRIPLYLSWGGLDDLALFKPFLSFWNVQKTKKYLPAWTNLNDDDIAQYAISPGAYKVFELMRHAINEEHIIDNQGELKLDVTDEDYYSNSLSLLARLAAVDAKLP